ncbi:MAG: hypothetical protein JXA14_22575 [Anaerolineae bacterium]|nr:hypothetical protein [Anaerolineae bacterium]
MTDPEIVGWLLENGGPAIRYRAATELLGDPASADLERLAAALVESPLVRSWLERLIPETGPDQLHGSKPTAYENAMGKLTLLGCRSGMLPFDERVRPFRDWLARAMEDARGWSWQPFQRMIVGGFLAVAGYHDDQVVMQQMAHRLDVLYQFARQKDYDIYVDRGAYSGIPAGFRDKPLVNPALYPGGEERFPSIYDIHALAHFSGDGVAQRQIDIVIDYVLHPDYQAFPEGYGIMKAGKRKYYAIGWSVHLPGYFGFDHLSDWGARRLVQRVVLMAHFPMARAHRWFRESLSHLETYRAEQGTYVFPRPYLREDQSGYWVTGAYMGLEENRRSKQALELESTFWMLKIRRLIGKNEETEP